MRTSAERPDSARAHTETPSPHREQRGVRAKPPIATGTTSNDALRPGSPHRGFDFSKIQIFPAGSFSVRADAMRAATLASPTEGVPAGVQAVLRSPGESLESSVRANLEAHLGGSLGPVVVHTDSKAAASARSVEARAYTVGTHIVFGAGEYRPGTMMGELLLAHEAAHVAQQSGTRGQAGHDHAALEREANTAALPFAFSMGSLSTRVAVALKSGIRLQRCPVSSKKIDTPSYFGPYSTEALHNINRMMAASDSLQNWTRFGTAVVAFEDPIAAMHSPEAQEALNAIPGIARAKMREEVDFLFVEHENQLNKKEKEFWNAFRSLL